MVAMHLVALTYLLTCRLDCQSTGLRQSCHLSVAQLDDFSHLHWDIYIDHLHIFRNPDSREI